MQDLDAPYQPRISRHYYTEEPIIIPLKAAKQLPDPRWQPYTISEVLEASDDTTSAINIEETTTTLNKLDHMLRKELEDPTTPDDTASTTKNTTE